MTWLIAVCLLQVVLLSHATQDAAPLLNKGLSERQACSEPTFETEYTDAADYNQQALDWHNYFRCQHDVPLMTLDDTLIADAQTWANHLSSTNSFSHSARCGVGENIWGIWGTTTAPQAPAWKAVRGDAARTDFGNGWYCSEYGSYNWAATTPGYQSGTGHFTQVVWRSSTKLGCGVALSGTRTVVVCQYFDGGNSSSSACWSGDIAMVLNLKSGVSASDVCPSS